MTHLKWDIVAVACALFALPLFSIASPPTSSFASMFVNFPWIIVTIMCGSRCSPCSKQPIASIRLPFASAAVGAPVAQAETIGAGSPIHEIALGQRGFYGQVVRFAPSPGSFTTLSKIRHAAESALALDDLIMLLEDGELELGRVGDIPLLIHISETSLAVRDALFRVLVNIELVVAR